MIITVPMGKRGSSRPWGIALSSYSRARLKVLSESQGGEVEDSREGKAKRAKLSVKGIALSLIGRF